MDWALDAQLPPGNYTVREMWTGLDMGEVTAAETGGDTFTGMLRQHATWAFRVSPGWPEEGPETTTTDSGADRLMESGMSMAAVLTMRMVHKLS